MKFLLSSFALISILFFSGCGYKEGVSIGEQKSFLYFSGNVKDTTISVDNGERFSVKSGRDNQYKIEPGKHTIRAYRNNKLVIEKEVYVADGIAIEVGVN